MKEINTNGIYGSGKYFSFRYEYKMKDFSDNSEWNRFLDFRPAQFPKTKNNGTEWNYIKEIKICLKGKRGIIIPSEIIDKPEENFSLSFAEEGLKRDNFMLRKMEIVLKDIHITIPLIPEQIPEGLYRGGLMGVAILQTSVLCKMPLYP